MSVDGRRKIIDAVTGTGVVVVIAAALWLVRCAAEPEPVIYEPAVTVTPSETPPDSVAAPKKAKADKKSGRRAPKVRSFLDEPVADKSGR